MALNVKYVMICTTKMAVEYASSVLGSAYYVKDLLNVLYVKKRDGSLLVAILVGKGSLCLKVNVYSSALKDIMDLKLIIILVRNVMILVLIAKMMLITALLVLMKNSCIMGNVLIAMTLLVWNRILMSLREFVEKFVEMVEDLSLIVSMNVMMGRE